MECDARTSAKIADTRAGLILETSGLVMENFPEPIKLEPLARRPRQDVKGPMAAAPQRRARKATKPRRAKAAIAQPAAVVEPEGLAARRERNGVSIHDIAERSRIPLHHLEELERGDLSQWPAGVYAKAWAREYAVEAGFDPEEIVALVAPVAAVEPSIEEIKHAREEGERLEASMRAPMIGMMQQAAAVALLLVLVALAVIYL